LRLRVVRRGAGRAAARSRAIFYNGPGPTSALRGPPLPFDEAIEEYRSFRGHKAFALARNDAGRRIWGFSFGYSDADGAVARALEECENRVARAELIAACRIHAVNDSVPSS
jgi:hypothetical protein